jgi:polar amino acid transport system permease protein
MPTWSGPVAHYLLLGLKTTVLLTLWSTALSIVVGVILGALTTLGRPVRWAVRIYVEVWRALPVLVTLFFVFFGLPLIGWTVGTDASATIALALWGSSNVAEISRGALQSVAREQFEAADALGMSWRIKMVSVIAPQALRRMIPSTVGTVTTLIQTTALASAIGTLDLIEAGSRQIERLSLNTGSSHALPIMGAILIVYFLISLPFTQAARMLENRLDGRSEARADFLRASEMGPGLFDRLHRVWQGSQ